MTPTKQQELILDYHNNRVIIAAPGSGKTYVISEKIISLIKSSKDFQGVIAISYTNKASNELRERCLKNGLEGKGSFFGTIDRFNISEIIIPFGKQIWGVPDSEISIIKIETLPEDEQEKYKWINRDLKPDDIDAAELKLLKALFNKGIILLETVGLLANYVFSKSVACKKYIKSKYIAIFIDEYQDSGKNQHDLFLKIAVLNIVAVAVGDLNQSIYAFSGKSSEYLLSLTSDKSFKTFKLDKNHRCHPSIINYSNYLLNKNIELIPTDEKRVLFSRIAGNEVMIAAALDKYIVELNRQGIKSNQIAILTRGNRTAETISANLKCPHKLLITTELDINLNVWSAIFNNLLRFAFDKRYRFLEVISEFVTFDRISKKDRLKLIGLKGEVMAQFDKPTLNHVEIVKLFTKIAQLIAPNSKSTESVTLLTQVLSLKTLLDTYRPVDEGEVNILTLHKSKGLEYDIVLHLDLYQWVFPAKGPGPNNDWNNPVYSSLDQDMNLHYVGITRARELCYLISSTRRTNNQGQDKAGVDSEFLSWNGIENLGN